jgi:hypothetical protein
MTIFDKTAVEAERWVLSDESELPGRFGDPRCKDFRCVCSNGFEGGISLDSAFLHNPRYWPQCFPDGEGSDSVCTVTIIRKETP